MCGLIGYIGNRPAQPILIDCLRRLEYRGYDSCGLALLGDGIQVYKDQGKVAELQRGLSLTNERTGIGHTRWATHGRPSGINAHPHLDCAGQIALVHNGIVTNFLRLRQQLTQEGHIFSSETDTEVIVHLIEKYYRGDLAEAVAAALGQIEGSYAIIALQTGPKKLVVARNESPLLIGLGDGENFAASDAAAILDYTDRVVYLEDGDIGVITEREITIANNGHEVSRQVQQVPWTQEEAQKTGYEHFMLKEIHEQPRVIQNTLRGHLSSMEPVAPEITANGDIAQILLLGCGTSYHAALVGKYLLEKLAKVAVRAELASEFNYHDTLLGKTWAIGITQSGETADTLMALRKAKSLGCKTLVITNVVGSSATRIADEAFYIKAGPEISVAATKSFIAQLVAFYLLALAWARIDTSSRERLMAELRLLPNKVQQLLDGQDDIAELGEYLSRYDSAFFIGRGINLPVALEGALKMKEISYIHAEGCAAGELKHGSFALLNPHTPVVAIGAQDNTYDTLLTNIKEIKTRGTPVIALAAEGDREIDKLVDHVIWIPGTTPLLSPVVNSVALQLLAYYAARKRGYPIDQPRNLAKSVTVE